MGYVINGKLAFRSGDQEEVFEAGDAYFVGLGHTPVLYAGTEVVESSPTEELAKKMEVVAQNMEAEPVPRTALLEELRWSWDAPHSPECAWAAGLGCGYRP